MRLLQFFTILLATGYACTLLSASAAAAEPEPYFASLLEEFEAAGKARLIAGATEAEINTAVQCGGGVEKFFGESGKEPSLLRGIAPAQDQSFAQALQLRVEKVPGTFWDRAFRVRSSQPVRKGETLLAVFWARGRKDPQIVDDGAGATIQAYFHSEVGNFPKGRVSSFYDCKMLGTEWQRYYIKTAPLALDIPAGRIAFTAMLGHKVQTVEVGGLALLAFPADADLSKLPKPSWDYPGRAADAPWRKEAAQRIDKDRKGDLTVRVVDKDGKPVAGVKVEVDQQRHAFIFGTAINVGSFYGYDRAGKPMREEDTAKYREISTHHYNSIVAENQLKWGFFERDRKENWKRARECLAYYKDKGIWIRGHVLVWPTIYRTPEPFKTQFTNDPATLGPGILRHIAEEAGVFRDLIDDWDVTNETNVNRDFMDKLGPEAMLDWYKATREAAPAAWLTFNEPRFGAEGMEIGSFPQKLLNQDCRGWVDYLVRNNAPLDSIGSQCHGGAVGKDYAGKSGPEGLWAYFDYLWSYYGKKLQYTELDVTIGDADDPEQLAYQADLLRDTITIAFAHPAFAGVTQWGFWEGAHHSPKAALWRQDWTPRPAGEAYLDLVESRWRTRATLVTGDDGTCTVRAFYGTYLLKIGDGQTQEVECDLTGDDTAKTVQVVYTAADDKQ